MRSVTPDPFIRVLHRARVLFMGLLLLVLSTTTSSVVLGWRSGEIDRVFVAPVRNTIKALNTAFSEESEDPSVSSPSGRWKKYVNITPTAAVQKITTPQKPRPGITRTSGSSTYEDSVQKMNSDAAAAKAAQDAWWAEQQKQFTTTQQQNQTNFDTFNQQAQQDMQKFQAENQAKLEEFKKANGF